MAKPKLKPKSKLKKEEQSKNGRAERVCGLRKKGTPLFLPDELGYACPICGCSDEVNLHWSEYNFFLWCEKCNLDIPSCLCVKYFAPSSDGKVMSPNERIEEATKIFLNCLENAIYWIKEIKCTQPKP